MIRIKKQFIFNLIISVSLLIFGARVASAASVSFSAPTSVNIGDSVDVTVNADSGGILVNSVELSIKYDPNVLYFAGYSDNSSVIKLWINPPSASNGEISLSGIIPGGVNGLYDASKKGLSPFPVVHLFFTAKNAGDTNLSFLDSKILEADGTGTPLAHDNFSTNITITNNGSSNISKQIQTTNTENLIKNNDIKTPNPEAIPDKPDPLFWIAIVFVIAGLLIYKLLKYKV
ncbi:MAG: cohesin domain-containing protein [Candidatus Pacebacteria bacterium]|nr:cohesin domain-containing protein [Candidatus Paceibacterota bacterium]